MEDNLVSYFNSITQNVVADNNNSSTGNLASLGWWTGTASSTLGIVGIQTSLKTDKDCLVYVDQSPDGTNWDIVDTFDYHTLDGGHGWTTQAINSYVRVRVKNEEASPTTYFRFQTALCPMVEAVPRTLDEDGYFQVGIKSIKDEYGFEVENTPMGEMRTVEPFRLVGTTFQGTTKDTNFWTGTVAGNNPTGYINQGSGEVILGTSTGVSGSAIYQTIRNARYIGASANRFRGIVQLGSTGIVGNSRKWGAFDGTNGCYFELDGSDLYAVTLKESSPTRYISTGWNTETVLPALTNANTYEIYWTNSKVYFNIGGDLKHVITASNSTWSSTATLPVRLSSTNTGVLQSDETLKCRVATIVRLGNSRSESIYKNISTNTTTVCKYGAGTLHRIVVNNPTNNAVTVYDNTSAAGSKIATIDPDTSAVPFTLDYDCPFWIGLTIVTAGTPDITVIYE